MTTKSSLKTTIRRASKSRTAWIVGIAAAASAVGAAVYFGEKSASAKTPPAVGPAPAGPTGTTPVWSALNPVASNVNGVNTYMVSIPQGATFAFADSLSDPNLPAIVNGLNSAYGNGTITGSQSLAQGSAPPSWWPNGDTFGTNGYRVNGVASSAFSLSLGPLSSYSPSTTPLVWVVTAWT